MNKTKIKHYKTNNNNKKKTTSQAISGRKVFQAKELQIKTAMYCVLHKTVKILVWFD